MAQTVRNDTLYTYLTTISRNSGFDKLRIHRSRGNSGFGVVYPSKSPNQVSIKELKDLSLTHKGDIKEVYLNILPASSFNFFL
ncbi:MAG: hypothetical protein ABIM31_00470 [candidate division WOR-3 bacterium]